MTGPHGRATSPPSAAIDPFDTLVDIVAADDLRTVLWPLPGADDDAGLGSSAATLWDDPTSCSAAPTPAPTSTACCGAPYPTRFLADCLRGRQLLSLERAVQLMTDVPARLFGLRDRGRIAVGCARRPRGVRSGHRRRRRRPASCSTSRVRACACSPIRSACTGCS